MRLLLRALAMAAALAVQTTLASRLPETAALDVVLVLVVYVALTGGATAGVVTGTLAGLVQDALSSGVMGIGALAKTLVGFAAGRVGTQFIVAAPLPRFVVFAGATVLHAVLFMGLYEVLGLRRFGTPYGVVAGQAVGNAVVGVIAFQVIESLPGFLARRRLRARVRR